MGVRQIIVFTTRAPTNKVGAFTVQHNQFCTSVRNQSRADCRESRFCGRWRFARSGKKEAAVTLEQIKVLREEDDPDDRFLVLTSTRGLLEEAPSIVHTHNDGRD